MSGQNQPTTINFCDVLDIFLNEIKNENSLCRNHHCALTKESSSCFNFSRSWIYVKNNCDYIYMRDK